MSSENKKENYHIISLIGQGAYGSVYKARRKFTGQFVAIKSIKKKGKEEKDIKVMRDEIEILKKLKHEHIILLLDSFETHSEFILVTELGQGELFNIIEDDQTLEQRQIRKIAQQLVRALHYIHANRIMHRDMKPQNILMTSDGVIKLCDFGFARSMSYKTEVLTSLKGTPLYMAPQVVKEEPYNHSADLWSLGVILYELATGTPPFTAPNLISLVQHISKDPIVYPQYIAGDFKSFLKGLLNKDPKRRLGWPDLLNHPFIRETQRQKDQRRDKTEKFSSWVDENHYSNLEQEPPQPVGASSGYGRNVSHSGFDDRSRDVSPRRENMQCQDPVWNKYLGTAGDEKGATQLRTDPKFLQNLLEVLQINLNELMRVKEKRNVFSVALKVLTQILMKSKPPSNKNSDNSKNLNIPNHLLAILTGFLKLEGGRQFIELISDITKLIGLLSKSSFQKSFGIEMVYVRSFVPLMPLLVKASLGGVDSVHQTFTTNLLRTTGIFANNASANHIRSFSFYKDLVEKRFIQECMELTKHYYDHIAVLKLFVQVLSAFMHPVYGEIECFPWRRDSTAGIQEYKECSTMLQCVRQTIINSLLESNCSDLFDKIMSLEDDSALLPQISVTRITLQAIRQSKEFADYVLNQEKGLMKYLFLALTNPDQVVFSTACQVISQLVKYSRQKKKEKQIEGLLTQYMPLILLKSKEIGKGILNTYGSLSVLQEIALLQNNALFSKVVEEFTADKQQMKAVSEFISGSQASKLEEMRRVEGSNYGIHVVGLYDPAFLFLHRVLTRLARDGPKKQEELIKLVKDTKMQGRISTLICSISSKTDLSPRGLISLLMLLYDLLSYDIWPEFTNDGFFQSLIHLLKEQQLEILLEWPVSFGGGEVCITTMFGNLMKIFLVYLQEAEREPEIVRLIFGHRLLELVISFTTHLSGETIGSVITFIFHLVSFDRGERDKDQRSFVKQFIQVNGMSLFVRFQLLKFAQEVTSATIEACNLLSQIAKHSKEVYQFIDSIEPYEDIKKLLGYPDPQIRSRALNLIGNMCRHSSYFYGRLNQQGVFRQCIALCQDEDKTIKKFACVAIGNASFHDDSLYEPLRPAIPVLVGLLKDSEEKTRSNAAAALGNLARNSPLLDKDFLNTGANYQLVNMLTTDRSLAAKKVSIMAIINLLELPESRKVLLGQDIAKCLQKVLAPPLSSDSGLVRTAQKALEKLK